MKATQAEPRDRAHVGDVSDPEPVWALGSEAALDQIRMSMRHACRPCGDRLAAAAHSLQVGGTHETGDLVPADLPPGAGHRVVHLSHPVDAVVLRVDPAEFLHEDLVPQRSRRPGACLRGAVAYVEVMNPHSVARRVRQMASPRTDRGVRRGTRSSRRGAVEFRCEKSRGGFEDLVRAPCLGELAFEPADLLRGGL